AAVRGVRRQKAADRRARLRPQRPAARARGAVRRADRRVPRGEVSRSSAAQRRWQWCAVAIAGVAAAIGIARNVSGWPTAATHLRDDAFYEFAWACNLARGNGPCVAPGVRTSGVQPLWCALLGWLGGGHLQVTVQFAVVLGALLHVATALSFAAAGRWRWPSWAVALWGAGHPRLLR